ncbi:sugar ABC transporter ATP-binding protein [Herbiconiux moechotypicola]|uniref:Autoinducer 2 import ATP-binding protein LsrA n=1 Tax=Herbiconiux moechotypicola TaxID=637393 RepID=A0ABN3DEW1_9MICO|nr:sugar ABC transporter ATP-binding protein [Herbiconiux moechotypicola]MCS5729359.1 sugar ABC transporter ATP-binding protein [Herbiconiux moechotypicola]
MSSETLPGVRPESGAPPVPRLEVESLCMTFSNNRVLRDVAIDVRPGEIHALIGQNGSGKSTLAKVLTGLYEPDPGTRVMVDGVGLRLPVRPREARERGVAVVHQSLGLIEGRSVLENMRVGRLQASRLLRRIDWKRERAAAEAVFQRLGRSVPLNAEVGSLREEDRATVAIARALQDAEPGSGLIIFDESTRSLGRRSLEHFFQILDEIVSTGTAVLMITHRLEEVVDAADRVTVLRDGRVVEAGREVEGLNEAALTAMMLGRNLIDLERRSPGTATVDAPAVTVEGLTGLGVRDVALTVAPGEVLGLTGLAGSGYDDVPYLLSGVTPAESGTLDLGGQRLDVPGLTPATAIDAGIALVPEGREHAGLAMSLSAAENAVFPASSRSTRPLSRLDRAGELARVSEWMDRLDVRPRQPKALVKTFSGGNQQKVLLAKWLATSPALFILHEPTQAVDVGARHTLVAAIRSAASNGCAVLVAGSDENELALLCDRVIVFGEGSVRQELSGDLTPDGIVEAIYSNGSRTRLRHTPNH